MDRTHNELRKPLINELEYLKMELELSETFNMILVLKQIKTDRAHEQENQQGGI